MPNRWERSRRFVALIDGRWTLAVLGELLDGGLRYQDLDDAIDGISHKVLTETLRRAERDGLITRHLNAEQIETATLYEPSELGRSLDVPLAAFERWLEAHWERVEAARQDWDRRAGRD